MHKSRCGENTLFNRLIEEGASKKLAKFICRLNEDLSLVNSKKRIDVKNQKIFLFEDSSPLAEIGFLNKAIAFVYDSRLFEEYDDLAQTVFSIKFADDYTKLLRSVFYDHETKRTVPSLLPNFHYFIVKFNNAGDVCEIELYSERCELLVMVSNTNRYPLAVSFTYRPPNYTF